MEKLHENNEKLAHSLNIEKGKLREMKAINDILKRENGILMDENRSLRFKLDSLEINLELIRGWTKNMSQVSSHLKDLVDASVAESDDENNLNSINVGQNGTATKQLQVNLNRIDKTPANTLQKNSKKPADALKKQIDQNGVNVTGPVPVGSVNILSLPIKQEIDEKVEVKKEVFAYAHEEPVPVAEKPAKKRKIYEPPTRRGKRSVAKNVSNNGGQAKKPTKLVASTPLTKASSDSVINMNANNKKAAKSNKKGSKNLKRRATNL